jgi:hypothetical protein
MLSPFNPYHSLSRSLLLSQGHKDLLRGDQLFLDPDFRDGKRSKTGPNLIRVQANLLILLTIVVRYVVSPSLFFQGMSMEDLRRESETSYIF